MSLPKVVPASPPPLSFVMLENAESGAVLVLDRMSAGPMLRLRRDSDVPGQYVAGQTLAAGQVVVVAAGTTGRIVGTVEP